MCFGKGREGLLWMMQKNQQQPFPPPYRMTVQGTVWIPNASFLFHSNVKIGFNQLLLIFQTMGVWQRGFRHLMRGRKRRLLNLFWTLTVDIVLGVWNITQQPSDIVLICLLQQSKLRQ